MNRRMMALVLIGGLFFAEACEAENPPQAMVSPQIFADVPAEIDPGARYLIYLHGAIIET